MGQSSISSFFLVASLTIMMSMIRQFSVNEKEYDERQLFLTYRAYRHSMLTTWGLSVLLEFLHKPLQLQAYTAIQLLLFTSLGTNLSHRILHHSLAPIGKRLYFFTIALAYFLIVLVLHLILNVSASAFSFEDWLNFLCLFLNFASPLFCIFYRYFKDKKEYS